jgi:type IV pilus assembly protein PilE
MKRGFTLLEILITIIIVGVLATLGLTQYNKVVERARGSEARQILGQLRGMCAAFWMETNDVSVCAVADGGTNGNMSVSTTDGIPSSCRASHYFKYLVTKTDVNNAVFNATRCKGSGKTPDYTGSDAPWAALNVNFTSGTASFLPTSWGY